MSSRPPGRAAPKTMTARSYRTAAGRDEGNRIGAGRRARTGFRRAWTAVAWRRPNRRGWPRTARPPAASGHAWSREF